MAELDKARLLELEQARILNEQELARKMAELETERLLTEQLAARIKEELAIKEDLERH